MIDNEKIAEWIDRYNRNDLHGKELEEFLDLLEKDPEITKEVKLDKDLNDLLKEKDMLDLRRKLIRHRIPNPHKGFNYPLILLAASVIILISLTIFFYFMIRSDDVPVRKMEYTYYPADTLMFRENDKLESLYSDLTFLADDRQLAEKLERELLAMREDFEPYPPFESLVTEVHRSAGFRLITPHEQSEFKKGEIINFTWKPAERPVTVILLNNRAHEVYRSELIITGKLSFNSSSLSPGLYYVKFIGNEELIFFSKFTLK